MVASTLRESSSMMMSVLSTWARSAICAMVAISGSGTFRIGAASGATGGGAGAAGDG